MQAAQNDRHAGAANPLTKAVSFYRRRREGRNRDQIRLFREDLLDKALFRSLRPMITGRTSKMRA